MASDIKGATTDELRLRNYRAQLQARNDLEVREIEEKHSDRVQKIIEDGTFQEDAMRQAYDVQISQEAENLEDRLHSVRMNNEERIAAEQKVGDEQVGKIRKSNQQKIEEYKKNSEAQLDALRKQYQASADDLHEKSRKAAKREKEVST